MIELSNTIKEVEKHINNTAAKIEELQLELYEHSVKHSQLEQRLLSLRREEIELRRRKNLGGGDSK